MAPGRRGDRAYVRRETLPGSVEASLVARRRCVHHSVHGPMILTGTINPVAGLVTRRSWAHPATVPSR